MLRSAAVQERVQAIFANALNTQVPSTDTLLIDSGVLDSLSLVELLVEIEREFSVSVPLEDLDLESFNTIRSISDLIVSLNGRSPG